LSVLVLSTLAWGKIYTRLRQNPNDEGAWDALQQRVLARARHEMRARSTDLVDSVVADTCSAVVVNLHKARGAETFASFVLGHYLNTRRRLLDRELVAVSCSDIDIAAPAVFRPEPDELALLRTCLEGLPTRERRAVVLRYLEGRTAAQIAAALDVTETNARRIVFNAITRLRRCARQTWPQGRG
jgi:RNA polymerase sigma factor (sigma-70 family)